MGFRMHDAVSRVLVSGLATARGADQANGGPAEAVHDPRLTRTNKNPVAPKHDPYTGPGSFASYVELPKKNRVTLTPPAEPPVQAGQPSFKVVNGRLVQSPSNKPDVVVSPIERGGPFIGGSK